MTPGPDRAGFDLALDELARATDRVLATLDEFSDADLRVPSGLPGWTRAHVLTHVARNADGMCNLAHWARTGQERPMYPGGPPARQAAIEQGSERHVGDLRLDLDTSAERLLAAFADFIDDALSRAVSGPRGATWLGWELPLMRLREVEIHHVDLQAGYTSSDWSDTFAVRLLDQVAPQFLARGDCPVTELHAPDGGIWPVGASGPTLSGPAQSLAAWLVGRCAHPAVTPAPPGVVPSAPPWS